MPASATAIRSLQRALLDVCLGQIEDVAEAVQLWQRLDQVLADALTGRAVAVVEAAGESRPVADDAARRAVADEKRGADEAMAREADAGSGRREPITAEAEAKPGWEASGPSPQEPAASHVKQPEPEPEPEPEPPLVITDEPRPPATPREPPPVAKRAEVAAPVGASRPWTVDEERRMQRWRDEGKEWSWIAQQLGRTKASCQVKMDTIKKRPQPHAQRNCLNCGRTFASTGPGNRLCKHCDGRTEGLAA